jgi:hypothetical protein
MAKPAILTLRLLKQNVPLPPPPRCALINAQSVKLSESWPKFKIFDFHEMLKKN